VNDLKATRDHRKLRDSMGHYVTSYHWSLATSLNRRMVCPSGTGLRELSWRKVR